MKMANLRDVAPPSASTRPIRNSDKVWLLNLDQVEAQTGRVLSKVLSDTSTAGSSTQRFDEGNVLFSKLRPYLNKVVVPDESGIATTELVPLRPDPEKLDRSYLAYYLRSPNFVAWATNEVAGAKMPRLMMQSFWKQQIPLPPLAEQKRIAGILDAADALRTKRRAALAQLDSLTQSLFLDLFGDPVSNPMGWEAPPLAAFCKTGTGGTPSRSRMEHYYTGGNIPWVKSGELREAVITKTGEQITEAALKETNVKLVPKDAILLALYGATVGRLGILGIEATTNQAVCHIIPDLKKVDRQYLFHALSNQVSYLVGRGVGGAQPNISQGIVKSLAICLPPLPLQRRFATLVESIERQKTRHRAHLAELDALFASLQHRAFRGEL